MTTVIGIAGKDPETKEDYVIIASDSRGSRSGKFEGDDEKKIFGNSEGNYVLGTAGKCLEGFFSKRTEKELSDFINNPSIETKETIENKLGKINAELTDIVGSENHYFVSLKESEPKFYYFNGQKLVQSGAYAAIGSGMTFTSSLNGLKAYKGEERVIISKKEALNFALNALNEAASKDSATGGKMDAAIITQSEIRLIRPYAKIENANDKNSLSIGELSQQGIHPYHRDD